MEQLLIDWLVQPCNLSSTLSFAVGSWRSTSVVTYTGILYNLKMEGERRSVVSVVSWPFLRYYKFLVIINEQEIEGCVSLPLDSSAVDSLEDGVNRCKMVCVIFPAHEHESICTSL